MATIQLQLLGHFYLRFDGEPVTSLPQGRLQSLLAYLALHRNIPKSRQYLAYLFWPDSTEEQARTNLRRQLHELRLALPGAEEYLAIHTQWIQWRPDAQITLDVSEFERLLAQSDSLIQRQQAEQALAALEQAVELYQGPLLRGSYDEWVLEKRQMLEEQYALR